MVCHYAAIIDITLFYLLFLFCPAEFPISATSVSLPGWQVITMKNIYLIVLKEKIILPIWQREAHRFPKIVGANADVAPEIENYHPKKYVVYSG